MSDAKKQSVLEVVAQAHLRHSGFALVLSSRDGSVSFSRLLPLEHARRSPILEVLIDRNELGTQWSPPSDVPREEALRAVERMLGGVPEYGAGRKALVQALELAQYLVLPDDVVAACRRRLAQVLQPATITARLAGVFLVGAGVTRELGADADALAALITLPGRTTDKDVLRRLAKTGRLVPAFCALKAEHDKLHCAWKAGKDLLGSGKRGREPVADFLDRVKASLEGYQDPRPPLDGTVREAKRAKA